MRDPFKALYTVLSGSTKAYTADGRSRAQIVRFYLPGELIATDAIGTPAHSLSVEALETTYVCEIPYSAFEIQCSQTPKLRLELIRQISTAVRDEQEHTILLGKRTAIQRLATFLVDLIQRVTQRGYSSDDFAFSMSRSEIGNYSGLTMETVSRTLKHFQVLGAILINRKQITIRDAQMLGRLAVDADHPLYDEPSPASSGDLTTATPVPSADETGPASSP